MTHKELVKLVQDLSVRVEILEDKRVKPIKPLYSVQEVAKILGVTKEAVYYMIKRGELPTVKFRGIKIKADDINNLIGERGVNA